MYAKTEDLEAMSGLWLRVAQGHWNEAEFEALFLEHYEAVFRHCFRIVGCQQEAEDLAQETFLRLYRQRFPRGGQHNWRAWLFRVSTNLAYNALRKTKRRGRREERASARDQAAGSQAMDPGEAALQQEERELVRRTLMQLRPKQARILLLRYAGLSYRELAEVLQVAVGSVGTLLARAEAAFEKAYRQQEAIKGGNDELP